jgi:hypothetical protein
MLLLSSGVSTAGGFDLRKVGWSEPPAAAAAALKGRGLLPDLKGWTLIFSGLGETSGRQPALPLPQQTTLAAYWLAICRAAGATACRVDESPRPLSPSRSRVPVPVVRVPAVRSVGPHDNARAIHQGAGTLSGHTDDPNHQPGAAGYRPPAAVPRVDERPLRHALMEASSPLPSEAG